MKSLSILAFLSIVYAISPRHVEIAKFVNSQNTTWIASEAVPTRNYQQYLGVLKSDERPPVKEVPIINDLPTEFDAATNWPECPSIAEIRDQSVCGSCWAFGAAEAATDRLCIHSKGKIQDRLSAEDLVSCCPFCGWGCKGGFPVSAWRYMHEIGISTGGEYGSKDWCKAYSFPKCQHQHDLNDPYPPCGETQPTPECVKECQEGYPKSYEEDKHFFDVSYSVPSYVNAIKSELMRYGPFEVDFHVYEDFLTYKSGIYQHVTGEQVGGHAVKIVGWGVEDGVEYWKIANSWNETWGENGYFRIIAGKDECEIESSGIASIPKL